MLSARGVSISWLSTDFAPIEHLLDGTLRAIPVDVEIWVLELCATASGIARRRALYNRAIRASRRRYFELRWMFQRATFGR
jgi:hypothetical protein